MSVKSSPNKSGNSSPATASSSPAPIGSAKRRSSADERKRKSRARPKFQDNPSAPEIVEKKALQLAEQASREESNQEEEDIEDEEEVDDDEDAAVRAASEASGCELLVPSSNGVHDNEVLTTNNGASSPCSKKRTHEELTANGADNDEGSDTEETAAIKKAKLSISDSVSSLVDDIVKQIDTESIKAESSEEAKTDEEELEEDQPTMINGDKNNDESLHKQLVEAVKDLSDPTDIKDCLINTLKTTLTNQPAVAASVKNPTETFSDIVAESSVDGEVRTTVVDELVSTYLQHSSAAADTTELKLEDDEIESTSDSFPPELLPQVDGVDSSAEGGKSDDHKEEDLAIHATKNELMDSNEEDECDEMKTTTQRKCDKSKILSEMENKFAKETQNALKNRPAYKRRNKSESWDLTNGKSESDQESDQSARKIIMMKEPGELEVAATDSPLDDDEHDKQDNNDENNPLPSSTNTSSSTLKTLRKFRKGTRHPSFSSDASNPGHISDLPSISDHDQDGPPLITKSVSSSSPSKSRMAMSPPPLTPEVGPSSALPLRIDIPDHYHQSPISSSSYSSGGYSRRLVIRTPPAARSGLATIMSEAVLSKEDAEVAATAVQLTPPVIVPLSSLLKPEEHPSLKIRLPKNGSGPSLVITSNSAAASSTTSSAAISQTTPHHKKVPKRRNLQNESDGGLDTEEEEPIDVYRKKNKKNFEQDHEKLSADEDASELLGGKATPDSQITSDDRQA